MINICLRYHYICLREASVTVDLYVVLTSPSLSFSHYMIRMHMLFQPTSQKEDNGFERS